MNEGSRQDDARAELLQYDEDNVSLRNNVEAGRQDRQENPKGTRRQNDEEKTNAQRDIVVTVCCIARHFFTASDTVPG